MALLDDVLMDQESYSLVCYTDPWYRCNALACAIKARAGKANVCWAPERT